MQQRTARCSATPDGEVNVGKVDATVQRGECALKTPCCNAGVRSCWLLCRCPPIAGLTARFPTIKGFPTIF